MEMEEWKTVERPLMSEEEFKNYIKKNRVDIVGDFYERGILHLRTYEAVSRFKSVGRAIRRGHISLDGFIYPNRPFNNAKHSKNSLNDRKKMIYGQLKHRKSA
nr:MAG TPA: hypothetical protein [Crassvirales sp.]